MNTFNSRRDLERTTHLIIEECNKSIKLDKGQSFVRKYRIFFKRQGFMSLEKINNPLPNRRIDIVEIDPIIRSIGRLHDIH
ncbi:hypothetical protein ACE193_21195 [Bernardetia sp. OM2101]|uniref:hypothetical protein n=1 Tax=Bernardetia sp. OM2101 TaxID=3344876 RepID=UPI0035CE9B90